MCGQQISSKRSAKDSSSDEEGSEGNSGKGVDVYFVMLVLITLPTPDPTPLSQSLPIWTAMPFAPLQAALSTWGLGL